MNALARYRDLERRMLALEAAGDEEGADALRDEVDGVWWELDDAHRAALNARDTLPELVP